MFAWLVKLVLIAVYATCVDTYMEQSQALLRSEVAELITEHKLNGWGGRNKQWTWVLTRSWNEGIILRGPHTIEKVTFSWSISPNCEREGKNKNKLVCATATLVCHEGSNYPRSLNWFENYFLRIMYLCSSVKFFVTAAAVVKMLHKDVLYCIKLCQWFFFCARHNN